MSAPSRLLRRLPDDSFVAVQDADGEHSYAAIQAEARRVAGVLLDGRASLDGERVAILVAPGARFVAALYGTWLAGGCTAVLTPLHPPAEHAYVCDDARVQTVVCSSALRERALPFASGRRLVVAEDLDDREPAAALPPVGAGAPAAQLYTSGTTGKPKGAVLTHENLAVQQDILGEAWAFTRDDVLLHALPLHHMHGLCIALLTALGAGATARMLPQFEARAVWEAMAEATVFMGVPTMYAKLFAALDEADARTAARWRSLARGLRLATSGSAALPVSLAERWRVLTGEIPLERFGMTEIGAGISNPLAGARRPGSVGAPLRTVRARVVDDAGEDAETGELSIAGPSVFEGYFERPDATRDAFVVAGDGTRWFKSGDTVARDADGSIRILGRTSVDILKCGGYKLSALEIEEVLREHPSIAEVAVVGVPDETWGDRTVACVVPRAGEDAACAEEAIRAFARERLAPYKVPRTVVLLRELPRNAMGKVLKPELVRELAPRREAATEAAPRESRPA